MVVRIWENLSRLVLNQHHTFADPALLRREMFERKLINRKRDGSAYWCKYL